MTSWIASVLKVSIHVSRVYSFVVSSCNVLFEMYLLGVSYVAISQLLLSWVRNLTVVLRCLFLFLRCLYTGMLDRRTSKSWSDRIVPSLYRIVLIFLVNENAILFTSFVLVKLIFVWMVNLNVPPSDLMDPNLKNLSLQPKQPSWCNILISQAWNSRVSCIL